MESTWRHWRLKNAVQGQEHFRSAKPHGDLKSIDTNNELLEDINVEGLTLYIQHSKYASSDVRLFLQEENINVVFIQEAWIEKGGLSTKGFQENLYEQVLLETVVELKSKARTLDKAFETAS